MPLNPKSSFPATYPCANATVEARRLRLEYKRLQRRLGALRDKTEAGEEIGAVKTQVDRVARDLSLVRADSVHAVEAKLRVALDLRADANDTGSQRLLSSAMSDLHYLAMLTPVRAN